MFWDRELEGLSSVPEQARRNGTEERPEWGACPAKPSKPLRTDTKRFALPLGVRTEFLAGCTSGFAADLSAEAHALAHLSARPARAREVLRARVWPRCGRKKREDCADVFATGTHGPRSGHQQDEVARIGGLPGE